MSIQPSQTSLEVKQDPGVGFLQVHNKGVVLALKEGVEHPSHFKALEAAFMKAGIATKEMRATPESWKIDDKAVFVWVCRK